MTEFRDPIFSRGHEPDCWQPSNLASGPFAGLQGGAVAGLLTGEVERAASLSGWGKAISASIWFLRPVPISILRTRITPVQAGRRISVIDNALWVDGQDEPFALARVTLAVSKPIEIDGLQDRDETPVDPLQFPVSTPRAPHGGPWFMDAMEVRRAPDVSWFRLKHEVIDGTGSLGQTLGPADWAHGINRPMANVVADPNPNLNVHLLREPRGDWIGVEARTHWQPDLGNGMGGGILRDVFGVIGRVSMSVALTPFPKSPT